MAIGEESGEFSSQRSKNWLHSPMIESKRTMKFVSQENSLLLP
jgi:hypothetical protein